MTADVSPPPPPFFTTRRTRTLSRSYMAGISRAPRTAVEVDGPGVGAGAGKAMGGRGGGNVFGWLVDWLARE